MFKPKILLLALSAILLFVWLSSSGYPKKAKAMPFASTYTSRGVRHDLKEKLVSKAVEAKSFTQKNNYNESVSFLVDMSLPSGQNRFFVYDLTGDSVQHSGLVSHGSCNQNWLEGRKYGNTVGCGCTSLGKYKIGNPYNGRFGLAFKLYGLDKTNDQAFSRFVVLHSHSCVTDSELNDDICQSEGCPMVAPAFYQLSDR
jgi:hypothetical protein